MDRVSSSGAAALRFAPGQPILWRSVDSRKREVHTVWPRVTVTDGDELIALYLPAGTVGKQRTGDRGGPRGRMLIVWDGGHRDVLWERTNVLTLYRPGEAHSVWLAWDAASWELRWRYLNLEEPWRRTPISSSLLSDPSTVKLLLRLRRPLTENWPIEPTPMPTAGPSFGEKGARATPGANSAS